MKTYEIKYEPVNNINKYNIYYYIDSILETKKFYAYEIDKPINEIKKDYNLKIK